jgi:hypothetical protein
MEAAVSSRRLKGWSKSPGPMRNLDGQLHRRADRLLCPNAHAIDYAEVPDRFDRFARNRPVHGNIPAAYISMIRVDNRFHGPGYGGDLLVDCLVRLAGAADALGIAVVVLEVPDCGDPGKVANRGLSMPNYGSEPLPSNGLRPFLPMATVRTLIMGSAGL